MGSINLVLMLLKIGSFKEHSFLTKVSTHINSKFKEGITHTIFFFFFLHYLLERWRPSLAIKYLYVFKKKTNCYLVSSAEG